MHRVALGYLLSLSVVGCAVEEGAQVVDEGLFDEANPAYGRGTAEYRATLSVSSTPTSDIITALSGWSCTTTATLKYSEEQLDHRGQPQRLSHEQASSLGWYSVDEVSMPFTRNLDHQNPAVDVAVHHMCSRITREPCPTDEDPSKTCTDSEAFSIDWECAQPELPSAPGQSSTQKCESRSSFWGFLNEFSWAPFFRDLEIRSTVEFVSARTSFDYDNCDDSNAEPFYLRVSQGLGGHVGEDDFVLYVEIDGEPIVSTPSSSGLYSLALAYCPTESQDRITVNLRAVEEDLFFDDEYTSDPQSTDMAVSRGETRQVTLTRGGLFGSGTSKILLEVFGEE